MVGAEDDRSDLNFRKVHEQFYHDLRNKCTAPFFIGLYVPSRLAPLFCLEKHLPGLDMMAVHVPSNETVCLRVLWCWYGGTGKNCWKMDGSGSRERTCEDISLKWPGAAPPASYDWCHHYLDKCYRLWDQKGQRDAAQQQRRAAAAMKADL